MTFRTVVAKIPGARSLARRLRLMPAPAGFDDAPSREVRRDLRRLRVRSLLSRSAVVDPTSPVVVTMTTHGTRLRRAHIALESIGRGTTLPRRLVLWLDDPSTKLTRPLRRLQRRGLEIIHVEPGLGVHTKYYPYVESTSDHHLALVTSDDDIIYPEDWLEGLVGASARHPESVVCYRAHRIELDATGLAPYATWPPAHGSEPSLLNFGTSVSGQLFPASLLTLLSAHGREFLASSAKNDDIWIHRVAIHHGVTIAMVQDEPVHFPFVPGTQATGLYWENAWGGLNDSQNQATYTEGDLRVLREAR